jgi:hypothetical protein
MVTGPPDAGPAQGPSAGRDRRVKDVALAVVAKAAPAEVPYFDDLSARLFDSPARVLHPSRPRDEPTGSGIPGATELVTSIVVAAVSGTLSDEIKDLIAVAARRGRGLLRWRARRKLRARRKAVLNAELPRVSAAESRQAQGRFVRLAVEAGMGAEQADRLSVLVYVELSEGGAADG